MSDANAQSVTFVRDTMLDQQEPPLGERGAVKWVRENLLSSPLNIILTVLSIVVLYLVASHLVPWMQHSVWNASSVNECREVLAAHASGPDTHGACWGVIRERWVQIMMGTYPSQYYWRCFVAFGLLFVAIAPVLYPEKTPRALLLVTMSYPFIMPWLIWGGSFWLPILAALGFVLGYFAYRLIAANVGPIWGIVAAVIVPLAWWLWLSPVVNDGLHRLISQPKIETAAQEQADIARGLADSIATLEDERDAMAAQIAEEAAIKDELIAGIRAERIRRQLAGEAPAIIGHFEAALEGDFETALAELRHLRDIMGPYITGNASPELSSAAGDLRVAVRSNDPLGDVPEDGALSDEVRETLTGNLELARQIEELTAGEGLSDEALDSNVAAFDASMLRLTELREQSQEIGAEVVRQDTERQVAARLARNVTRLEANAEALPELQAAATELRAGLPEIVQAITEIPDDRSLLDPDITPEELEALEAAIAAESAYDSAVFSIDSTYKDLGRIGLEPVPSEKFGGFQLALLIGVSAITLSLPLGILLALGRQTDLLIIRTSCVVFIEVIRGVPLIVWLMVANFLLNFFLPPGTEFDKVLRVIIMLTFFSAAYIAEVVRGGLAALPRGQYEAADALGLDYWKSMRLIVLPQALKISIPGIVNTFIGLFKDTVLVIFIALLDPIGIATQIRSDAAWQAIYWELFIFIGLIFFIFCFSMGRYSLHLEKKLQREHR